MKEIYERRREQMFPKLAAAQIARLAAFGTRSKTRAGEVLVEPGERAQNLFVVLEGSLEVEHGEEQITVRSGSVKRIASAVGEGAMSIQIAHQVLASFR